MPNQQSAIIGTLGVAVVVALFSLGCSGLSILTSQSHSASPNAVAEVVVTTTQGATGTQANAQSPTATSTH